ncbi:MAG TPA: response regulator transcription factor [Jatrophihabitans sp.]|jgi:DNA-binding NarL/FixJ family response regulator|uniref:response regulator n=1 Tax=Jatrophihabitans sp. TaxID=1932789 RepID=UPI002F059EA0
MTATRLIFVDRHPVTRLGLALMVNGQPDLVTVGEAGTATEAIGLIGALRPDVVTIGLSLPDRPGFELATELRDRFECLGIVIFTGRGEDDVLFRALETGASAFVSKTATAPEILGAIRHAAVSASSFSSRGLAAALRRRRDAPALPVLSERERQVLSLLLAGLSVPDLAIRLHISVSTAKTYVARLYDKLGANSKSQALLTAVRLGLVDSPAKQLPAVV